MKDQNRSAALGRPAMKLLWASKTHFGTQLFPLVLMYEKNRPIHLKFYCKCRNIGNCLNIIVWIANRALNHTETTAVHKILYDVAVIQWITSCHKNRMTTRVITLWRVFVTSFATSVSTMRFLIEIMFILKVIKIPL